MKPYIPVPLYGVWFEGWESALHFLSRPLQPNMPFIKRTNAWRQPTDE